MVRFTLYKYVFLLLAFGFAPDFLLSLTTDINAFSDGKRIVAFIKIENSTKEECFLYSDRGNPLPINEAQVLKVTPTELEKYLTNCRGLRFWSNEHTRRTKRMIFPGTKWCGVGNVAKNFSDLGRKHEVDKCCRDHDHCDTYILPFHRKYNLYNFSFFTRNHCECERKFRDCLQNLKRRGSKTALLIYGIYFQFLRLKCIEEKRIPVCVESQLLICKEYQMLTKMTYSSP